MYNSYCNTITSAGLHFHAGIRRRNYRTSATVHDRKNGAVYRVTA